MSYIFERLGSSVTVDYFDFKLIQPRKILVHNTISDIDPWGYQFMSCVSNKTEDIENKSVVLVIPTCDSDFYLLDHLSRVVKNICNDKKSTFLNEFIIHILVVINGETSSNFQTQLMRFLSCHKCMKEFLHIAVIHVKNKSKVLAMNYGDQYALSNNINYIFFMDDDVILYPRTIPRLLLELLKGNYALVGGNPSLIKPTCLTNWTKNLFSKIVTLKRRLTRYSLPVGRLLGMKTKNYPIIPNYIIADDVFLNAFCLYHKLPQKIITNAYVGYLGSTSYFQWLSRSFRIEVSDQQILSLLPIPQRIQLQNLLHHIPFQSEPSQEQLLILDFCRDIKIEGLRMLNNMKYSIDTWGADFSTKITSQNKFCIYDSHFNNLEQRQEVFRLNNLGFEQLRKGQLREALETFQKALVIVKQIDYKVGEGIILTNIGGVYENLAQYPEALKFYQQALVIFKQIDGIEAKAGEGSTFNNIGLVYHKLRQEHKALEFFQQALAIFTQISYEKEKGTTLNNIGEAYRKLGEYPKALESLRQGLEIFEHIDGIEGKAGKAATLLNFGVVYESLGQYRKALDFNQQALKIFQKIPYKVGEGTALNNIGEVHRKSGEYPKALKSLQQSLAIRQQIEDKPGIWVTLNNIGLVYYSMGQYPKALESLKKAVVIHKQIGEKLEEGTLINNIGSIYYNLGEYPEALKYYRQALAIHEQVSDKVGEVTTLSNIGYIFLKTGKLTEAIENLRAAIDAQEILRPGLKDTDKVSIIDTQRSPYQHLQQAYIAQNQREEGLQISERGRARALAELLAEKQKTQIQLELTINQLKQIAKEQNATLVEYSIIDEEFKIEGKQQWRESQLYIWVVKPTGEVKFHPVDLNPLWQQQNSSLSNLVNKTLESLGVAIGTTRSASNQQSFAVGDFVRRNNEDFSNDPAWKVVAVNRQNRTLKIRLTTWEENVESIERTFAQVTKVLSPNEAYTNLQQLHKILIDPIADLLPKDPNARVTFIPQGSLFFVPFPALQDADRNYLIQKHTILTSPAIQVLDLTRKQRQKLPATHKDLLIVGNPTMPKVSKKPGEPAEQLSSLPNAEREAKQVAQLFNTQAIIGDRATKSIILQQLPKARIVHFATHGLLDDFTGRSIPGAIAFAPEPLNQGKQEAPNSLLTASEIFDLKLNAELVVLSACNTGVGRITGDGVIGLSRSLISAGVPSVIVSLWSIPDAPTASLMTEFYQRLQQSNDKASSLRQAMLKTMEKHPDPKNWAAFTLIGESN